MKPILLLPRSYDTLQPWLSLIFEVSLSLSVDFVSPTSSFLNVKLGPEEDHMLNLWFIFYTLSYRTWYVLQARIHRP